LSGITSADKRTILNRWPTFVARLRYQGENEWDTYQVAGLFRRIGYENDDTSKEYFDSSWGVSASARFKFNEQRDAFFIGGVCGDGIGSYIYGSPTSVRIPTSPMPNVGITALRNYGAYAAINHIWTAPEAVRTLSSNFGYGYLAGQTSGKTADAENRRLHQAWANLLLDATANSAYGFEYQYGNRLVGSGKQGEDHRIMFVVQIGTKTNASGGNQSAPASATSHAISQAERSPSVNASPSFAATSNTRLKYRL
jgi:hypothetical protein